MKNTIYTLRLFKGKETYDVNGKITSENQLMKLEHNTRQFDLFIKSARNFFTKIEVLKATDGINEFEINEAVKKQLEDCVKLPEKELSTDEKRIKELESRLLALESGKKESPKVEKLEAKEDNTELETARLKYLEVFGKKPHHLWKEDTINEKINEKLNS